MFGKAFVINLPFKQDRLAAFRGNLPKCLGEIVVWPAVHGDSIRHPDWWKAGAGAWGCYRSHLQILEYCYQQNVESYVVFEDDAIFKPAFETELRDFLRAVPPDWQQIYLGGQLLHENQHPPKKISDLVYAPYNVNRTHCFAVHRRGYEKLYKHLNSPFVEKEHIDHHLGRLHETGSLKLYVPARWLVGQDNGPSNISGKNNQATFWVDPEKYGSPDRSWQKRPIPAVFLESTIEVAVELERRGWHRGHWQNAQRLDHGICNALTSTDVRGGLHGWYKAVMPEAVRQGSACVCLYHPTLNWACATSLEFAKFHRIKTDSAADAETQLAAIVGQTETKDKAPLRRNLIYHVWPRQGNGVWKWNVEQLLRRIDQFDGVRSIGVVTDGGSDSLEEVQQAFGDHRIDHWKVFPNDPQRGETVTFKALLDTLPQADGSVTFYGHAKGVRHGDNENIRSWAAIMYEVCLDNPKFIDASLEQYPITGPFKNTREYKGQTKHGWHYSGTFFWFRNRDLYQRDWSRIQDDYYGTEKWPGDLFQESEAGDLFGGHIGWLYHVSEMDRATAMLKQWRKLAASAQPSRQRQVPIYINARNLLTPLRKMVDYLVQIPNARPIIVDNDSTWQPLIEWYESECPVEVIRTGKNGGKFGWSEHLLNHAALGIKTYVVTDSDLDLSLVPLDVLDVLEEGLDNNPGVTKCGLSLDFEVIPDDYQFAQQVKQYEAQYWRHRSGGFCHAGIDTTFAMRRARDPIAFETHGHRRADRPYIAIHWPWSWTPQVIAASEEIQHYLATSEGEGLHWTPLLRSATKSMRNSDRVLCGGG